MRLDVGRLNYLNEFGVLRSMKLKFLLLCFSLGIALTLTACWSDEEQAMVDEPTPTTLPRSQDAPSTPTRDPLALLDETAPMVVISTRSLRVRAEPEDEAKVIGAVRQHERYVLLAISANGKYLQVEVPALADGTGWIDANFVTIQGDITNIERGVTAKSESAALLPTPTQAEGKSARVVTDGQRLRVHKEPNTTSPISGRVNDGDMVNVVETSKDGKWQKIAPGGKDNPDGGWVATEFLKFE